MEVDTMTENYNIKEEENGQLYFDFFEEENTEE
jgi:hypothetical protein